MSGRFKTPNDMQAEIMRTFGMNPKEFAVSFTSDDFFCLFHYKSGDEITIRPNILKKARHVNGNR